MVINCYPSHNGNPVYRVLPPSPKLVYKHLKTIVIFLINHGIHQVSQLCYHKSALDPIRSHRNPHSSWLNQVESPCSKGVFFPRWVASPVSCFWPLMMSAFFSRRASTLPQPRNEAGVIPHGNEKFSGQMVNNI
jgi:hypothetical protein